VSEGQRIILGLDPGLAVLGYGFIRFEKDHAQHLEHGCLVTSAHAPVASRLRSLFDGLAHLRQRYPVTDVAMESLFYGRGVRAVLAAGEARGVAILAVVDGGVQFAEYSPGEVKEAVAGMGHARKRQVQEMVGLLLNLSSTPSPDDAADALAVALCHARRLSTEQRFGTPAQEVRI
jgi:crossover junction endodeoxyribonuclease RuvC